MYRFCCAAGNCACLSLSLSYQKHNVHIAQFVADGAHQLHYALGNLVGRVDRNVIGAGEQDDGARLHVVQFAVLQAPQRVLRLVVANAKVKAMHGRKVAVPGVDILQRLQNAVADEDDVRILFAAFGEESVVLYDT